jgi:hypothetical protein
MTLSSTRLEHPKSLLCASRSYSVLGIALISTSLLTSSCGKSGGQVIGNTSKLTSSAYSSSQRLKRLTSLSPTACTASATTCTPSGFSGRVFAASAMIGEKANGGLGDGAFAMTFLADDEEVINRPDLGKEGSLTFDLTAPAAFSGLISIPSESDMPAQPYMPRVEIAFDYLDTTFTLSGTGSGALDREWIVRTVFVDSTTLDGKEVQGGDQLLSSDGGTTWKWCSGTSCSETRPSSPFQQASIIAALATAGEREGNTHYAYYSVDYSAGVDTTYAEISDTTRLWTIDFDVTGAIQWGAAPSTFTTEADVIKYFTLPYACNYSGCAPIEGITASLNIGAPGSATAEATR